MRRWGRRDKAVVERREKESGREEEGGGDGR